MRPRTFFYALLSTFTSARYYLDVLRAPWWFSFRFFLMAMICLGLTRAAFVNIKLVPTWKTQLSNIINQVERDFPPNLVISWDGRSLHTSDNQTVAIPYPTELQPQAELWPPILGFIVPQTLTADQFSTTLPHRSLMVATTDRFFVSDSQGEWSDVPLNTVPGFDRSFSISRETLPQQLTEVRAWTDSFWAWATGALVVFSATYVVVAGLWMSVLEGLFAFLVLRFSGFQLPYRKAVQLSLHLIVVAETLSQLSLWLYGPSELPLFSISFWCLFAYVVWTLRTRLLSPPTGQ